MTTTPTTTISTRRKALTGIAGLGFGLVGLGSIGPIIAILLMGIVLS